MSHAPALPPQAAMFPWAQAGSVAWSLPIVTRHWADPPLPAMSEMQLVAAHQHDAWDATEERQRAFAGDPMAVEAEAREIERAQRAGATS